MRDAEQAVLTLVSRGAGYDATHPVVIATLLHALTLARSGGRRDEGGNGVEGGWREEGDRYEEGGERIGQVQGQGQGVGSSLDVIHEEGVDGSTSSSSVHPGPHSHLTSSTGPSPGPSPVPQSDPMTRAGVLFAYLRGLGEHAHDPRSASARRLLPMCYHHMCAGYR